MSLWILHYYSSQATIIKHALLYLLLFQLLVLNHYTQLVEGFPNAADESTGNSQSVSPVTVVSSELGQPARPMSCYVCSTMDYTDNVNNGCKKMRQPERNHHLNLGPSAETSSHYHSAASPSSFDSTTPPSDSDKTTSSLATTTSSYLSGDYSATPSHHQEQQTTGVVRSRQHKPAETPIRTRQCSPEEHYCSIVSVNKLDVKNNTMFTKFWALERNCSKSCNTGCLIIGEKIKLRVCSLCCRTSDCNFQNGGTLQLGPQMGLLVLVCALSLAGWTLAGLRAPQLPAASKAKPD